MWNFCIVKMHTSHLLADLFGTADRQTTSFLPVAKAQQFVIAYEELFISLVVKHLMDNFKQE